MTVAARTFWHAELSVCSRLWRARDRARFLRGRLLTVYLELELDEPAPGYPPAPVPAVGRWLEDAFDHATLVAADDPELHRFRRLAALKAIALHVVPATDCASVAGEILARARAWLAEHAPGARCTGVEASERGGAAALVRPPA